MDHEAAKFASVVRDLAELDFNTEQLQAYAKPFLDAQTLFEKF